MTSSQKVTQSVCWLRNLNFSLETYQILTTSQWIRPIFRGFQPLNTVFPRQSEALVCSKRLQKRKFEQNLKIWKSKIAAAYDVIYLTIVAMETN